MQTAPALLPGEVPSQGEPHMARSDPAAARRLAEEARLAVGPAYTARGPRGTPRDE